MKSKRRLATGFDFVTKNEAEHFDAKNFKRKMSWHFSKDFTELLEELTHRYGIEIRDLISYITEKEHSLSIYSGLPDIILKYTSRRNNVAKRHEFLALLYAVYNYFVSQIDVNELKISLEHLARKTKKWKKTKKYLIRTTPAIPLYGKFKRNLTHTINQQSLFGPQILQAHPNEWELHPKQREKILSVLPDYRENYGKIKPFKCHICHRDFPINMHMKGHELTLINSKKDGVIKFWICARCFLNIIKKKHAFHFLYAKYKLIAYPSYCLQCGRVTVHLGIRHRRQCSFCGSLHYAEQKVKWRKPKSREGWKWQKGNVTGKHQKTRKS